MLRSSSRSLWAVSPLLFCFTLDSLQAQFDPGPNPISSAESGQRELDGGTGTVTSTGSLTLSDDDDEETVNFKGAGTVLINQGQITRTGSTDGGESAVAIKSSADGATINNSGTISNSGAGRAIRNKDATDGKITIQNSGTISALNDDTIKFDDTEVEITNSGLISSSDGQALDLADIETQASTITNQSSGIIRATGSDAFRPGVNAVINNSGTIDAIPVAGSGSDGIQGGENTGILINNSGTIQGRHGITGGVDDSFSGTYTISVTNQSAGLLQAVNGSGVNIDGLTSNATATVVNELNGTITGTIDATSANGDGDGVDVDGVVHFTNHGTAQGLGAKGVDSGGQPNNPEAVAAGGGTIINTATGLILGNANVPNGAAGREGRGILIDDGSGGSGVATTTITNDGLIRGVQGFAAKMVGNFEDEINNNATGVMRGDGAPATIQTGAGNDTVTNAGAILHDSSLIAITLQDGDDTLNVTGGSASIQGDSDGGNGTDTLNLNLGNGNSFAYDGSFTNFEIVNVNSGTTILGGDSSFSGTTTVADGAELIVNGSLDAATVSIENGGLIGGAGDLDAPVTVASGAVIAAGNSPGVLNFTEGLAMGSGVELEFELSTFGQSDLINVTGGTFEFQGGTIFIIDDSVSQVGQFVLIDYTGASLNGSVANFSLAPLPVGWAGTLVDDSGNNRVVFNLTAVPEPSTGLMLLLSVALMVGRRRDR